VTATSRFFLIGKCLCAALIAATALTSVAQSSTPSSSESRISAAWDSVIKDAVPEQQSVAAEQKKAYTPPAAENFLNHFYIETRTEYSHYNYSFSGQPTATGVVDQAANDSFSQSGFPYPPAFQSTSNEMYSYVDLGTRGLGSDRINTNFAVRYRSDLTNLMDGSPSLNVLNTFPGAHLFDIMSGNIEINGRPTDGWFANSSVRFGRQTISGPYLAEFDGVSYTRNGQRYSLTLYGGRRFSYFSDPVQRGIGGLDFSYRLTDGIRIGYESLFYTKGNHSFTYSQRINESWLLNGYFRMAGRHPVDFSAQTFWTSASGKTNVGFGYFQKLSNYDYVYDYTDQTVDNDPHNTYARLYLGLLQPYSQGNIDVRHTVNSRLRVDGGVIIRRLNSGSDQSPFDTSFNDYHVGAEVFPVRSILTTLEYREHDSDRVNPLSVTTFLDPSASGETKVQEFSAEVGRSFIEDRLNLQGGGFFRRINYQTSYVIINNAQDKGWLASASYRVDPRTRLYFDYSLDTDFFVWRPAFKNGQVFRVGVDWKF
jgi:hypothetical protein